MNKPRWRDLCKTAAQNPRPSAIPHAVPVRPSNGAVSTTWNPDNANTRPRWGYAFKCPDCDTGYANPSPSWSPKDRARFMKEVQTYVDRHKRMCALRKNSKGGNVDFEAARRAYLGK